MTHFLAPLTYQRRMTRAVRVGNLTIGGDAPIRVQSMLTADTANVDQVMREMQELQQVNCELIRLTVPNQKAVDSLPEIRRQMKERGWNFPLVADIHFNPQLAVNVCEFVEKVRINPGNYADRKNFVVREYTEQQYQEELERIEEKLQPLIRELKKYQRALRIGTNHGSLSDRILNRFGDSPQGMVESALEFVRVFEKSDFYDTIISMKSSNPLVMMQAYRALVVQMEKEDMQYPLHLGVTEAGNGLDARIKSAVGIGSLLVDGMGDTIRVSLTEPPQNEVPAAKDILASIADSSLESHTPSFALPLHLQRRVSNTIRVHDLEVGSDHPVRFFGSSSVALPTFSRENFDSILPLSFEREEQTCMPKTSIANLQLVHVEESIQPYPDRALLFYGDSFLRPIRKHLQWLQDNEAPALPLGLLVSPQQNASQWARLSVEMGSLLADGFIDFLVCPTANPQEPIFDFCQTLLQATRARLFKAEFIACPSCGRTFFDLQATTASIQARTRHLKGVKIGIMGCIVNGPGEMADADFGYVGAGEDKINLYRGQECVERNIPATQAVERLIALIKEHGYWIEP